MINSFLNVLYYTDKNNSRFLCIEVWQSLENIKRGSLLQETKANSLLGHQFSKSKKEIKTKKIESNNILIERDHIIVYKAT